MIHRNWYDSAQTVRTGTPAGMLAALLTCFAGLSAQAQGLPDLMNQLPLDCNPEELSRLEGHACRKKRMQEGERLFTNETFGGNGRTCETCHSRKTGTFSPRDVARRLERNPDDALFTHDGLDDGEAGVSRILQHATVRITLPLPGNISLKNDPDATHVTVNRGTPTVTNTPALDPRLMYDIRNIGLQEQALGAIQGHAQNQVAPTPLELDLIAEFQQTAPRFFSNDTLREFAKSGVPPKLPEGDTESERRGRLFFIDAPFNPPDATGVCGLCHSGPMLNAANVFSSPVFGNPPGARIFSVGVSERNLLGNPLYTFVVEDTLGPPVEVTTPDLGVLITPNSRLTALGELPPDPVLAMFGLRRAFFGNMFKTPTLWGVKDTAPYFHDNSARDLDEMLEHYDFFFANFLGGAVALSQQDKEDIRAFLELL